MEQTRLVKPTLSNICNVNYVFHIPASHPGDLAFGQLTGGGDARQTEGGRVAAPAQKVDGLAVTHRAHGRAVGVEIGALHQGTHFVEEPVAKHGVEPRLDAGMEFLAIFGKDPDRDAP